LRETAPGCGSEDFYAHCRTSATDRISRSNGLEFSAGVRADFAIEVNLFVLRRGPFHEKGSFRSQGDNYHTLLRKRSQRKELS